MYKNLWTIREGRVAYAEGSSPDANPYKKARLELFRDVPDNRLAPLRDLERDWDSGYAQQKRIEQFGYEGE